MTSASEDHPAGAGSTGSESGSPSEPEPGSGSRAEPGAWGRALWLLIAILPRNAISRCAGRLASLRLPAALQRAEIRLFARLAGVDLEEAAEPVEAYPTLNAFFTRALRSGVRPIAPEPDALVAPCDGEWGRSGRIEDGTLLQVKGQTYRVAELLADAERARAYEGGSYATFYLAPRDYHRFHTPAAGTIRRVDHQPGSLWPVNSIGLNGVERLFARNERICAYLEADRLGSASPATPALALVAVGAMMVGSVRLSFDSLRTNVRRARPERRELGESSPHFERGEQWGHFEFGSTIVLLTPPGRVELRLRPPGERLRLGERIGRFLG